MSSIINDWANDDKISLKTVFIIKDKGKVYTLSSFDNGTIQAFRNSGGHYLHSQRRWFFPLKKLPRLAFELEAQGIGYIVLKSNQVPMARIKFHFETSRIFQFQHLYFTVALPLPAALLNEFNNRYVLTRSKKGIKIKGMYAEEFMSACMRHQVFLDM